MIEEDLEALHALLGKLKDVPDKDFGDVKFRKIRVLMENRMRKYSNFRQSTYEIQSKKIKQKLKLEQEQNLGKIDKEKQTHKNENSGQHNSGSEIISDKENVIHPDSTAENKNSDNNGNSNVAEKADFKKLSELQKKHEDWKVAANKVGLRRERLQQLEKLCEVDEEFLKTNSGENHKNALKDLLVPDGAAGVEFHASSNSQKAIENSNDFSSGDKINIKLKKSRRCYVCKIAYDELRHHFYDALCYNCACFNWEKRIQSPVLDESVICLVTGCRVKIGFQATLKLLRAGATVIGTSRFRNDALERFRKEVDFHEFENRLILVGIDLRFLPEVEKFCGFLSQEFSHLDVIVHNACQTIRRHPDYYAPLREFELKMENGATRKKLNMEDDLESSKQIDGRKIKMLPDSGLFVSHGQHMQNLLEIDDKSKNNDHTNSIVDDHDGKKDAQDSDMLQNSRPHNPDLPGFKDVNGQLIDFSKSNSWVKKLEQVETPELCETFLINSMAPFIMNSKLINLLQKSPRANRFIVNVSAMEGKFYRYKLADHPHTNMAKAALNMMTRTSGKDYSEKYHVFMNSVDTGWINDERPLHSACKFAKDHNWQTPIDEIDAAARILDPVFTWIEQVNKKSLFAERESADSDDEKKKLYDKVVYPPGVSKDTSPPFGQFLKDYFSTEW
eukprot:gene1198-722_t